MSKLTTSVQLNTMAAGEHFIYAGLEFIALEHTSSGTVAVTANCVCDKPFDNRDSGNEAHNDWRTSTLKKWLNGEFLETLLQSGATEAAFTPMLIDLTADDGLDDYRTDESKVGLLGVENYRKYRKLLPPIDNWWWLITPYSTKANGYSCSARIVISDGTLSNNYAYGGNDGVRPICTLQSSILVSKTEVTENE